jgi:hypothetical protein
MVIQLCYPFNTECCFYQLNRGNIFARGCEKIEEKTCTQYVGLTSCDSGDLNAVLECVQYEDMCTCPCSPCYVFTAEFAKTGGRIGHEPPRVDS